jgi:hypothetical protein
MTMDLSYIKHGMEMLVRTFHNDPVRMIVYLGCASAVTLVIALLNDALADRRKPAAAKNPPSRPPR